MIVIVLQIYGIVFIQTNIYLKKTMAKGSKTAGNSNKVSFGKKGTGKAQKSHNKNDRKERNYRGQGR